MRRKFLLNFRKYNIEYIAKVNLSLEPHKIVAAISFM